MKPEAHKALFRFIRAAFRFHAPDKILLDSPSVLQALELYRPETGTNFTNPEILKLSGCRVERWIFPYGVLLIPLDAPTPEVLKIGPNNIVSESNFPEELAELRTSLAA